MPWEDEFVVEYLHEQIGLNSLWSVQLTWALRSGHLTTIRGIWSRRRRWRTPGLSRQCSGYQSLVSFCDLWWCFYSEVSWGGDVSQWISCKLQVWVVPCLSFLQCSDPFWVWSRGEWTMYIDNRQGGQENDIIHQMPLWMSNTYVSKHDRSVQKGLWSHLFSDMTNQVSVICIRRWLGLVKEGKCLVRAGPPVLALEHQDVCSARLQTLFDQMAAYDPSQNTSWTTLFLKELKCRMHFPWNIHLANAPPHRKLLSYEQ